MEAGGERTYCHSWGHRPLGRPRAARKPTQAPYQLSVPFMRTSQKGGGGWREFRKKNLLRGAPPAPPSPGPRGGAEAARAVPLLRGVVVGVPQRGGGAPRAWRVPVGEVQPQGSVVVVRLVFRPAGVAGAERLCQYRSLPDSEGTRRKGLALIFLLPKGPH